MSRGQQDGATRSALRPRRSAVTEVGLLARRILRDGRRGRIAAVFERSVYAVFDDDRVCIGLNEIGSGPLHVLCNGLTPHAFSPGQELMLADGMLSAGDMVLTGLDAARMWRPAPSPRWTRESLRDGLLAVDGLWHVTPAEEGLAAAGSVQRLAPQSRAVAAAAPALTALAQLIDAELQGHRSASQDQALAADLIGLGPGLTPSGDDLLGGAMIALASLGSVEVRDALWDALRGHLTRTNDISAAHLCSAAQGYAAAALHDAIGATMAGRTDRIPSALVALASIGHSSGRDAFAGALIAFRAVLRQRLQDPRLGSAVAAA